MGHRTSQYSAVEFGPELTYPYGGEVCYLTRNIDQKMNTYVIGTKIAQLQESCLDVVKSSYGEAQNVPVWRKCGRPHRMLRIIKRHCLIAI